MKKIEKKEFLPYVNLEKALNFDPKRPETSTGSHIVDAVMEAIEILPQKNSKQIAEYMNVNEIHLNGAVMIIMGMKLIDLRDQWILHRYLKIKAENPEWQAGQVAEYLGYANPSALWKFLKRMHRDDLIKHRDNSYWHREFKSFSFDDF